MTGQLLNECGVCSAVGLSQEWFTGQESGGLYSRKPTVSFLCSLCHDSDFLTGSQDLSHEEEIGQQCPQMARRVQIVDQLGAESRLREHQLNGRQGISHIAVQHGTKCLVR